MRWLLFEDHCLRWKIFCHPFGALNCLHNVTWEREVSISIMNHLRWWNRQQRLRKLFSGNHIKINSIWDSTVSPDHYVEKAYWTHISRINPIRRRGSPELVLKLRWCDFFGKNRARTELRSSLVRHPIGNPLRNETSLGDSWRWRRRRRVFWWGLIRRRWGVNS